MSRRVSGRSRLERILAVVAGIMLTPGLAIYAGVATAAPPPTLSEVKAEVTSLTARLDGLGQRYDQLQQQLSAAHGRLAQVQRQTAADQARFTAARAQVAQLAAAAFEDSGSGSVAGLLTSGDPAAILKQGSLLTELAGGRDAQVAQLLAAARQLTGVRQGLQRTEDGITTLRAQVSAQRSELDKLLASKQAVLASLTTGQQAGVTGDGPGNGVTTGTYTGPTGTPGGKAVAFVYAQLGKPYLWGATGPGSYDCSGLVETAWASAGVAIPRDTYEQWAALPHIPLSDLQPGDLLFYDGVGHVAMYVGGGYIIDAPQTGMDVQLIPMDTGWYAATFIGAARP